MVLAREQTGVICIRVIEAEFTWPWSCNIDYFDSKNGLATTWVMYGLPDLLVVFQTRMCVYWACRSFGVERQSSVLEKLTSQKSHLLPN